MFRIITLLLALSWAASAMAQELYVLDNIPITLRAGQGTQYRIIAMISSENVLTRLEEGDGWTRVRIENGSEGWVLTRYLTRNKPARQTLAEVEARYAAMQSAMSEPAAEMTRLKEENQALREQAARLENTLQKLAQDYEDLQRESAEYLEVRDHLDTMALQFETQQQRAEACETTLGDLQKKSHLSWFLSGAGVLLLGLLIGLSMRRKQRRPSLL